MADTSGEPKPIIPALAPFYDKSRDLSWLVVRCTAGGMLLVHGLDKVIDRTRSQALPRAAWRVAASNPRSRSPMWCFSWRRSARSASSSGCSRASSPPRSASSFCSSSYAHWAPGFGWNRPGGGWEYPLFWGLIWLAIGLRGGGPYSLDRKLGREL